MIPYGKQSISREDIEAVVQALESDWLTTGPNVVDSRVCSLQRSVSETLLQYPAVQPPFTQQFMFLI